MKIETLRTPEARFDALIDWPYAPHYLDNLPGYESLRVHYVDEGSKDADKVFLSLHGEPTWAYLYRKMTPVFQASGARVICPDSLGFGRSDKPLEDDWYGFQRHRDMMIALIERLDLHNVTLVVQDWGGILGLTLPMNMPDRIDRLLIMNTTLAAGKSPGQGFVDWRAYVAANPDIDVGRLMGRACPHLSPAECSAYGAPFPDIHYKAGVRRFPEMVITEPDMEGVDLSKRALGFLSQDWDGESFMAIGMNDPAIVPSVMHWLRDRVRVCPPPLEIPEAGHFLQEWRAPVARAALAHWGDL